MVNFSYDLYDTSFIIFFPRYVKRVYERRTTGVTKTSSLCFSELRCVRECLNVAVESLKNAMTAKTAIAHFSVVNMKMEKKKKMVKDSARGRATHPYRRVSK